MAERRPTDGRKIFYELWIRNDGKEQSNNRVRIIKSDAVSYKKY